MSTTDYASPDALVSTSRVAEHLNDPKMKIIEVDVDTTSYGRRSCRTGLVGAPTETGDEGQTARAEVKYH